MKKNLNNDASRRRPTDETIIRITEEAAARLGYPLGEGSRMAIDAIKRNEDRGKSRTEIE